MIERERSGSMLLKIDNLIAKARDRSWSFARMVIKRTVDRWLLRIGDGPLLAVINRRIKRMNAEAV